MMKKTLLLALVITMKLLAEHEIYNAMWLHPEHVDYSIADAIQISKQAGVKRHAVIIGITPGEKDPLGPVEYAATAFEKMRAALEEQGITAGIWVGRMLGHGWSGQMIAGKNWTEVVNETQIPSHRLCMLDPNFRKHVRNCFVRLARTRPAFLLIDDDMRTINNSSKGMECFCPLHVALYNQKTGLNLTSGEWIRKIKTSPASDPAVQTVEAIRRESLRTLAKIIRAAIDEVNPDLPCGFCCSGAEYVMGGEIARILAGKNRSFMRINNADYMEGDPKFFHECMFHSSYKSDIARPVDLLLSEDDTWPHNRFSKSATSFHAHICGSIINGTNGSLVMLSDYRNRNSNAVEAYRVIMEEHKGYYDALLDAVQGVKWLGISAPTFPAEREFHPAKGPQYLIFDMQMQMMSRYGFPCQYGKVSRDSVNVLSKEIAALLTDEELKTALSAKAIVDGGAAVEIARRGMADLLGVHPVVKPYRASWEVAEGETDKMAFYNDFSLPLLADPAPGAIITSSVRMANDYNTGLDHFVAPGSVFYQNRLGGRVVTLAIRGNAELLNIIDVPRKAFMAKLLRMIDSDSLPAFAAADHDVWFKIGKHPKGGFLAALVNLSFDPMPEIRLNVNQVPRKVSILTANGSWKPVEFETKGNLLSIKTSVMCFGFVALRLE